ncbi:hypothetical protein GTP38_13890 [Duganella sp. FT94W]|uniref:Transposase n=1 Tax=Duganella lactea TaxID=2692173 RepID=A0ABW9V9J6_9BURK|nr:hypothetical protein [Duganella lactea]MYM35422.1 hypothetical protein [Duganella lactea]
MTHAFQEFMAFFFSDLCVEIDWSKQPRFNPFAWVTLAHLRTQRARRDPDQLYAAKWQLTKLLFQHGWSKARIIELFKVINWMMVLPPLLQRRYWRAVVKLEKESKMECGPRRNP